MHIIPFHYKYHVHLNNFANYNDTKCRIKDRGAYALENVLSNFNSTITGIDIEDVGFFLLSFYFFIFLLIYFIFKE
jgi:hypothetical protein